MCKAHKAHRVLSIKKTDFKSMENRHTFFLSYLKGEIKEKSNLFKEDYGTLHFFNAKYKF